MPLVILEIHRTFPITWKRITLLCIKRLRRASKLVSKMLIIVVRVLILRHHSRRFYSFLTFQIHFLALVSVTRNYFMLLQDLCVKICSQSVL